MQMHTMPFRMTSQIDNKIPDRLPRQAPTYNANKKKILANEESHGNPGEKGIT